MSHFYIYINLTRNEHKLTTRFASTNDLQTLSIYLFIIYFFNKTHFDALFGQYYIERSLLETHMVKEKVLDDFQLSQFSSVV